MFLTIMAHIGLSVFLLSRMYCHVAPPCGTDYSGGLSSLLCSSCTCPSIFDTQTCTTCRCAHQGTCVQEFDTWTCACSDGHLGPLCNQTRRLTDTTCQDDWYGAPCDTYCHDTSIQDPLCDTHTRCSACSGHGTCGTSGQCIDVVPMHELVKAWVRGE